MSDDKDRTVYPVREDYVYRLEVRDHILDNIYGQIGLTEVERQIELSPLFKRLHNVSQLGLVNWIFPCALHTRYTHSVGVMHVAGLMAEHINQNMGFAFFDDSDIQILRLAGLLHDIGHYPMSHNIEQAYKDEHERRKRNNEIVDFGLKQYINCPDFLNPLYQEEDKPEDMPDETWAEIKAKKKRNKFLKGFSGSTGMHHENVGRLLIEKNKSLRNAVKKNFVLLQTGSGPILNPKFAPRSQGKIVDSVTDADVDQITESLMKAIGAMVVGNYAYETEFPWAERYSAMVQIIHSELDADNLDYLVRDASFSGTSYGIMDMGMLLNSLTVATLTYQSRSGERKASRYIVGIKPKGLGCIEQFLLNKFLAYTQMILSKYASILEAMLLRVESDYVIPKEEVYSGEKLLACVEKEKTQTEFLKFSDYYIFRRITDLDQSPLAMRDLPYTIINRLVNSCAFSLKDKNSECLSTGFSEKEIKREITKNQVYKDFRALCKRLKGKQGGSVWANPELSKELFAFRFERFSLTKQLPLDRFLTTYALENEIESRKFNFHYYRLGNGVPVVESGYEYVFIPADISEECEQMLPPLCVDCTQSLLHKLYSMEYISLRRYEIKEFSAS